MTPAGATTVREAVFDLLRQLGLTKVFGNPGSTELAFLDRWPEDFDYILGLQEASVVAMADGYARASGGAAFVNLHSAAGVGHALGNIFTAFRNQAPLVITAGQQARALLPMLPFLGASDAATFPKPYVKFSIEPARAADVPGAIAQAYYHAMQHPRGPVFVSIPADDWSAPCRPVIARRLTWDTAPDPAEITALAAAIAASRRPVVVAGPEIDAERAGAAMVELAEAIGAPVWTSPFASRLGFPETHPLFAGFLDAAPQAVAQTLVPYDLIVVIGAPVFTFHVGGICNLFDGATPIFQLTTDPDAAASAPVGTTILGSLRLGLPALRAALPASDRQLPSARAIPADPKAVSPVSAAYLLRQLRRAMPPDAILVEEAPSHRPVMHDYLPLTEWNSFFTMASGGLGYALPAAAGISIARPGQRIICLIGDGSFMYSPQAIYTAVQHRLPVVIIVINNAGYGAMRGFSKVLQVTGVPGIELPGLDFVSLASGMGCPATCVTDPEDLDAALQTAFATDGPMLVEVAVDNAIVNLYDKNDT